MLHVCSIPEFELLHGFEVITVFLGLPGFVLFWFFRSGWVL